MTLLIFTSNINYQQSNGILSASVITNGSKNGLVANLIFGHFIKPASAFGAPAAGVGGMAGGGGGASSSDECPDQME